jgi:hypothetical protein
VIPLHIAGPYPIFFHTFSRFSKELSDITLFHELLNKSGRTYRITVGRPIAPDLLSGGDALASTRLKAFCEKKLGANPDAEFAPIESSRASVTEADQQG